MPRRTTHFQSKTIERRANNENPSKLFKSYLLLKFRRLNCQRAVIPLSTGPENTNRVIVTRLFIETKNCLMLTAIFSKYKTCITTIITTLQSFFVTHTIMPVVAAMFIFSAIEG